MGVNHVSAQANKTFSGDVACPASGSSIQILPIRSGRFSYLLNNTSGIAVRIGYLETGTANLDSTNSWLFQIGQATADSAPGVFSGRLVCMSTTAGAATISFNETYR